jgi:hypothetical protein
VIDGNTWLTLQLSSGRFFLGTTHVLPDPVAARREIAGVRHALAVRIDAGPTVRSANSSQQPRRGPIRRALSLAAALALTRSGLHTVVVVR